MNNYRYKLKPYKGRNTRGTCPECGKAGTFSSYIDSVTGEPLHNSVGRCNREIHCGYLYTPKQYFQDRGQTFEAKSLTRTKLWTLIEPKTASYIKEELLRSSLKEYEYNNLTVYLNNLLGPETTTKLISRYFVGTSKHWPGATVFWQIDLQGRIRTGKIMLYDTVTGRRVKEPYNHIQWVHSVLRLPNYNLTQCLFGAHLLQDNSTPVGIVESEKTAIIASAFLPQFVWLATGGLANLNPDNCRVLKGRNVTLFPDLGGFDKWARRVQELSRIARIGISNLLERTGTKAEQKLGLDMADYLIRYKVEEFA